MDKKWTRRETSDPYPKATTTRSASNNIPAAGWAGKAGFTGSTFNKGYTNTMQKANDKGILVNSAIDNKNHEKTYNVNFEHSNGTNKFRGQQGNPQHFTVMSNSEVEEHVQGADFFGY